MVPAENIEEDSDNQCDGMPLKGMNGLKDLLHYTFKDTSQGASQDIIIE